MRFVFFVCVSFHQNTNHKKKAKRAFQHKCKKHTHARGSVAREKNASAAKKDQNAVCFAAGTRTLLISHMISMCFWKEEIEVFTWSTGSYFAGKSYTNFGIYLCLLCFESRT
jgi:hypothetical protein